MISDAPARAPAALSRAAVSTRNHSIDAFRVVANFGIVWVHAAPFLALTFDSQTRFYGELANQLVRVATPFFFLAAGYFFALSVSRGAAPLPLAAKLIKRLMLFFVFWSAVYIVVPIEYMLREPVMNYPTAVRYMLSHALSLHVLLNGTKVHLWFLPALSCSIALLAGAVRFGWERAMIPVSMALYGFGLIAGAYQDTPIGWDLTFNTRNGPFFGTLFVVSGYVMYCRGWEFTKRRALSLIAIGLTMRVVELWWITGRYGTAPSDIDYMLGTYPFGIGIFMLLLTTKRLGEIKWMVRLSRYSAGVYCGHALAIELLKDRPPVWDDPLWEITRPFVALALTFGLVIAMSKLRWLRPVVS